MGERGSEVEFPQKTVLLWKHYIQSLNVYQMNINTFSFSLINAKLSSNWWSALTIPSKDAVKKYV